MISLSKLRKLDPGVAHLSDEELKAVRESFYGLGSVIFEDWCEQKFGSKFPIGDNNDDQNKGKI